MENIILPHAKLFYFIAKLSDQKLITESEKYQLKEFVITEKMEIFQHVENYQIHKDDQQLSDELIRMIRGIDLAALYGNRMPTLDQNNFPTQEKEDSNLDITIPLRLNTQFEALATFVKNNPDVPDEISSPYGTQLFKRKHQHHKDQITQLTNYLHLEPQNMS